MIADCEICKRKQVSCKSCEESQRAICYICQDDVADPYCELEGRSYADMANSATTFDPEAQFDRDIDLMLQKRAEHLDFLADLLADGEIDCSEFRLQASDDEYSEDKIAEVIKSHEDVMVVARAIAEKGFGRSWNDFLPTNAHDTDQSDLIGYARAAVAALRAHQ